MIDLLFEDERKELLAKCEDIVPEDTYVVDEYTKERDRKFDLAQKSGVDLSAYSSNEYTGFQLHEIRLGLEHKVNVSLYDDLGFSWEQMRQIRKGLEEGLDVSLYADLLYSDAQMKDIQDEKYSEASMQICRHHHEKYDGSGYPDGLKGDDIPLSAQIVSIADVYDSLLSKRVYKNAYDPQKAYTMIMNGECSAFSSTILDCLSKSREKLEALYVAVPQQ